MFCSECGKTIDDEALICPECGAVTKNGILALKDKEATKQNDSVDAHNNDTAIKSNDNSKKLRTVAIILGLAGSASLLSSLLGEFCSITVPILGKTAISVSNYLDKMIIFVFLLAGFSIIASLLKYGILQIITGSITGAWIGYIIWDIQKRASDTELKGALGINFGFGTYLFILAACLIIASGITYAVAAKKQKSITPAVEKNDSRNKKAEIIVGACLGVLIVCGILFVVLSSNLGKTDAKNTVSQFMNAAIHYDVDTMKSKLSSNVNDKNGLMEAYTPDTMSNAFLSNWGVKVDELNSERKATITETSVLFGKNYLKKYNVGDVTKNDDGSFTVKVTASILDMSTVSKQIQQDTASEIRAYANLHPDEINDLYYTFYTDEAVASYLVAKLFPCYIVNSAIKSAGSKDTEITFVVKKVEGGYKITEIDYKD